MAGASYSWFARSGFQLWTGCPNSMTCCEALSRSNELAKYFKWSSPCLIAVTWSVAPLALQQGTFLEVAMWGIAWGEVSGGGHFGAWLRYQGSLRNMHTKLHDFFKKRFRCSVKSSKNSLIFMNHWFKNYHYETVKFHDCSIIWKHFPKCHDFSRPGIQISSTMTFDDRVNPGLPMTNSTVVPVQISLAD